MAGPAWARGCVKAAAPMQYFETRGGKTKLSPELMRKRRRDRMRHELVLLKGRRVVLVICILLLSLPMSLLGSWGLYEQLIQLRVDSLGLYFLLMITIIGFLSLYQNVTGYRASLSRCKKIKKTLQVI